MYVCVCVCVCLSFYVNVCIYFIIEWKGGIYFRGYIYWSSTVFQHINFPYRVLGAQDQGGNRCIKKEV